MICKLCRGSGSLVCFDEGKPIWWECPCCGGMGCKALNGPDIIKIHKEKQNVKGNMASTIRKQT